MGGLDHSRDIDGNCFPGCKECRIEMLERKVEQQISELEILYEMGIRNNRLFTILWCEYPEIMKKVTGEFDAGQAMEGE